MGTRVDVSYPYLQVKLADAIAESCDSSTSFWTKAGNSSSGARITTDQANMLMSLASSAMLTKRTVNIGYIPGDCVRSEPRLVSITVLDE